MNPIKLAKRLVPQPVKSVVGAVRSRIQNARGRLRARREEYLCRNYYGNTVQYWANVKGADNWTAARKAYDGPLDRAVHEQFMKLGYADVSSAGDMAIIKRVQACFNKAIADPNQSENAFADAESIKYYNHGNYQGPLGEYRRHVRNCHKNFPDHMPLLRGRLAELIQSCLGSHFHIESVHAYRNTYCPLKIVEHFEPHASRWHFDDQVADGMRLFVYLTDVTPLHGPFQCFDRGYSRYLLRKGFSKEARKSSVTGGLPAQLFETPRLKSNTGPAGTMVLCATSYCMHRACEMLGEGNHRDVLMYNLRPALTSFERIPVTAAA